MDLVTVIRFSEVQLEHILVGHRAALELFGLRSREYQAKMYELVKHGFPQLYLNINELVRKGGSSQ